MGRAAALGGRPLQGMRRGGEGVGAALGGEAGEWVGGVQLAGHRCCLRAHHLRSLQRSPQPLPRRCDSLQPPWVRPPCTCT